MRVKLQFQQQSKMVEGHFFSLYFGNSDGEFEGFDPEIKKQFYLKKIQYSQLHHK